MPALSTSIFQPSPIFQSSSYGKNGIGNKPSKTSALGLTHQNAPSPEQYFRPSSQAGTFQTAPHQTNPLLQSQTLRFGRKGERIKITTLNAENFAVPRRQALARLILQEDPDVLVMQEAQSHGLHEFNRDFLNGSYAHILQFPIPGALQVAILVKGRLGVSAPIGHYPFQCSHRHRNFLETTITTEEGYQFTVFTVHFRSQSGKDDKDWALRREEAEALGHILRQRITANPDAQIVVAGDFNVTPNSIKGNQILRQLSLANPYDPRTSFIDPSVTVDPSIPHREPAPTYLSRRARGNPAKTNEGAKLDYIFVSPSFPKVVYHQPKGLRDPLIDQATDHGPVSIVIREPAPAANRRLDRVV